MKKISTVNSLFVALSLLVSVNFQNNTRGFAQNDSTTVRISIVGDLMCHTPEIEFASAAKDSFDFRPIFSFVKKYLKNSDLTFGNLETTLAGKERKYSGYPLFNSPDEFISAIKDAGFNVLFTANNHSLDRGTKGIIRTLDKIYENGMTAVGTFKSEQERDSIKIFDLHGIKIAVLAYTYGLNGNYLPPEEKFMVGLIDTTMIGKNVESARKKNADVILAYFHFGEEYQRKPGSYQKKIVAYAKKCGADIIVGSHPHVIQTAEFFKSTNGKLSEGLVVYSLGNFISNQRWRYSDAGVILNIELTKNKLTDGTRLSGVTYIPTWVFKGKVNGKNEFVILPSDTLISSIPVFLSRSDRTKLLRSYSDVKKTFQAVTDHS